ncbi:MAG: transglycosylase SLT domain-containing protein, partial [Burkholderiales bacterium]|nr:transglycosylase SLT domain-containing protein [Burkholderiales bacterium]
RLLDEYQPPPETPRVAAPAAPVASTLYAWDRVRAGFSLAAVDGPLVARWQAWYLGHPQLLQAMFERSRRYVYHVLEELEKRGMPTELALLPMVESGYNPEALSSAQAAGLWQFIPSTGKEHDLEQNLLLDARRDILASTSAALDYLQSLHERFGDWRLALAAYNSGEGAVANAIARNKAGGLPTAYSALPLPDETRNYLPKLQALKNIVANPGALRAELERVPNRPYFATVASDRYLDVDVAARLAEIPLEEFIALNPAFKLNLVSKNPRTRIVLPVENIESFLNNLENYREPAKRGGGTGGVGGPTSSRPGP